MVMFKAKEMPKTVPVADGDDVEKRPENVLINVLKEQDYPETTQKTTRKKLPRKNYPENNRLRRKHFLKSVLSRANEWEEFVKKKTFEHTIEKKRIFAE